MIYQQQCGLKVEWYEEHGKHPDRIVKASTGVRYVMGDVQWNARYPSRAESIKLPMANWVDAQMRKMTI